jgi:hypothetical protein
MSKTDNSTEATRPPSLSEQLLELEKKLLDPLVRRTPEKLGHFLTDNFVEFSSGGRAYDKKQIVFHLRKQLPGQLAIEEFRAIELTPQVALVTYRARAESAAKLPQYSLRSSLWVQQEGMWKMLFHQGTTVPELM